MMGLTKRQAQLLGYIKRHTTPNGSPPKQKLMAEALGVSAPRITMLLRGLEQRGYIRRLPTLARAIEIVEPRQTVGLSPQVLELAQRYAAANNTTLDRAVNQILRDHLEAAA